jgi:hypothetical protein
MTGGAAFSIAIPALVALALNVLLGSHSGAASLPDYRPASQTQADEINQAAGVRELALQVGNVTLIHAPRGQINV